jgi:hypothetical protein
LDATYRARRSLQVLPLAGLLAVAGCAQTFDATSLGVEATMASSATQPAVGEPFSISKKSVHLLIGLIPAARPRLDEVLSAQVTSDARVADLRIKVRSRWSDVLISLLTGFLVVPRTVTFEGVVVRP